MVDHVGVDDLVPRRKVPAELEVDHSVGLAEQHEGFFIHTNEAHDLLIEQHHITDS